MSNVREVLYTPDNRVVELSADEKQAVANRISAMQKLLEDGTVHAKYKLEVLFTAARSTWKPTGGFISFWENGSKFHGGGDVKIYICPGKHLGKSDCEALIPDMANSMGKLVCTSCGEMWDGTQVIGELFFKLTMQNWAQVLYRYYRRLDCHADIYLKHAKDDIRSVALAQKEKATFRGAQELDKIRARRARHIYPLQNIIRDTSAGSDLLARFYAFLVS